MHTCTILTCEPNELVGQVHNRMPVMLDAEARWQWLNPALDRKSLMSLLAPYPAEAMKGFEVSRAVNSPGNDNPDVVKSVEFL